MRSFLIYFTDISQTDRWIKIKWESLLLGGYSQFLYVGSKPPSGVNRRLSPTANLCSSGWDVKSTQTINLLYRPWKVNPLKLNSLSHYKDFYCVMKFFKNISFTKEILHVYEVCQKYLSSNMNSILWYSVLHILFIKLFNPLSVWNGFL